MPVDYSLYYAAVDAEAEFQTALEACYGVKQAGNARYKPSHDDPRVTAARVAKHAADTAWRAHFYNQEPK